MQEVSKLEAESLKLCGFKIVRTKHKYYLLKIEGKTMTGYADFL